MSRKTLLIVLVVSLANTNEPLFLANRGANSSSQQGAAELGHPCPVKPRGQG